MDKSSYLGKGKNVRTVISQPRWLVVTVDNYGKTPAYVSHIAVGICSEEHLPKPDVLPAYYEERKMFVNLNVPPGKSGLLTPHRYNFSEAQDNLVHGGFYYTDIFGDSHSSGFILRVLAIGNTMAVDAPPEYTSRD